MSHGAACTRYPVRAKFKFFSWNSRGVIDITGIKRHFLVLVMAREGRLEKKRQKQSKEKEYASSKVETITQLKVVIVVYTRVPDVLLEIFAGAYHFSDFLPNRKNSQNIQYQQIIV